MKKTLLAVIAATMLASGCALFDKRAVDPRAGIEGYNPAAVTRPQPTRPNLFIEGENFVVIDQEPIRIFKKDLRDGRAEISWALPFESAYSFHPTRGIVIGNAPAGTNCGAVGTSRKLFVCSYPFRARTVLKYEVRLMQGARELPVLDPTIYNME